MKHQIMTVMLDAFLLINALPSKFLQKRFPPIFSMVHLLHRLYGVDAPAGIDQPKVNNTVIVSSKTPLRLLRLLVVD